MIINATLLRPGMLIIHQGDLYRVTAIKHLTPGNKRGHVQTKLKNVKTGVGTENRFRSEDRIERATLETRSMQYLYEERNLYTFMDTENFEQIALSQEEVGDLLSYLLPSQVVQIEFFEGKAVGVNPPGTVDLEVVDTEPIIKGATASASYKPAKLETGVTLQVPPFIQVGDRIRVDPSEGRYLERVK